MNKTTIKTLARAEDIRDAVLSGEAVRGLMVREVELGNVDAESRTAEIAFSSEIPVNRGWFIEILDHDAASVDMTWLQSGRAPFLAGHNPDNQIGVIESARIDKDRIGRAVVRFSKSAAADAYFQDVVDGIRTNISVGYSIEKAVLEEETKETATYRVVRWQPLEISLVSIPADQSVGVGRAAEYEGIFTAQQPKQETTTMDDNKTTPEVKVDIDAVRAQARADETKRITEITALARKHNMESRAEQFIAEGKTVEEFRGFVLDNLQTSKPVSTAATSREEIGLNEKEKGSYSFLRIMRAMADPSNKQAWEAAAFEREVSDAVEKKYKNRKFQGNVHVPTDVLMYGSRMHKRDLNVGNAVQGGYLVADQLQPAMFIELLRNRLLTRQMGARVLTGLEGNLSLPKQTGGATAYWLNEGEAPVESQQSFGQVNMTPKTVGAYTDVTRRMLQQGSLDIENLLRDDLARSLATAIDLAALKGSGAGGEPLGIKNTSGVGTVTITTGTYTYGNVVELEGEVELDNAAFGSLGYITSIADKTIMKQTEIATGTARFIWANVAGQPGMGEVNGYMAAATKQLAADETIFGNWDDLLIGEWGVLDLLVNPFAMDTSGGIRVRGLQDVDIAVRRAESFAITTL